MNGVIDETADRPGRPPAGGVGTATGLRTRWAAIGAAVAVALGAGAGIGLVGASSSPASSFVAVTPVRILDTRTGVGLEGPFVSASGRQLQVTGSVPTTGGPAVVVPAGATAVSFNVTAVQPSAAGFVAVRPAGTPGPPSTSSLNVDAGAVVPNAVTVVLPANGRVEITFDAYGSPGPSADLLIDVLGYHVAGGGGGGAPGPAGPAGAPGPAGATGPAGPGLSGPLSVPRVAFTAAPAAPVTTTTWATVAEHPLVVPPASCPAGSTPRHQFSVVADGMMRARGAGADSFVNVDVVLALDDASTPITATLNEAAARSAGASVGSRNARVPYTTQYVFEIAGSGGAHTVYLLGRIGIAGSLLADAFHTRVRSVHEGYTCS